MILRAAVVAAAVFGTCLIDGAAHADSGSPALWQLKGRSNSVYLLGSVHALSADAQPLAAPIMRAYREAEILYMEVDLDDLDPTEVQQFTLTNGLLPPDKTLAGIMGPARYGRARTEAQKIGLDLDQLGRLEPWVVAISAVQAQVMRLGLDPQSGVEQRLVRDAVRDHKEVRGLETVADQFGIFDRLSLERQQDFLLMSLEDAVELAAEFDALISAWTRGDVQRMTALLSEGFEQFPDLYQPLIVDRNRNWTRQIIDLLDDDRDYLVVVGVLHLVGEDGVIELLDAGGITAKRL